ncbi:MAG: class I SAM-dependent methyltransferase [Saprospiraceae bacterium]
MLKQLYRFFSSKYQNAFLDYPVKLEPRYGHGKPAHQGLSQIIGDNRTLYAELLTEALKYSESLSHLKKTDQESDSNLPIWNNGFLPGLDIVGIYTILSKYKPKVYMEIGSGNSTKVAYMAKKDQKLDTKIVSIDPYPRAEIDALADQIIRQPFENIDLESILSLSANDVLFVDNSHRILPNSDANVFFLEILPRLKKGVIVHIHDVYLPYDYPQFMCDRYYSEQYGLAMFLLANPSKYKTILPNFYISEDPELSAILKPFWALPSLQGVETHGGSYWLQIAE